MKDNIVNDIGNIAKNANIANTDKSVNTDINQTSHNQKNRKNRNNRFIGLFLVVLISMSMLVFHLASPKDQVFAQAKKKTDKKKNAQTKKKAKDQKDNKDTKKSKDTKKDQPAGKVKNFWQPEVTGYFTIPMAMSSPLNELFGMGFGGHLAMTFRLSGFLPALPFGLRAGVLTGYSLFSGADEEFKATSTRLPFIAFGEADVQVHTASFVTRFIGRIGQGMALTAASSSYPNSKGETVSGSWSSADSALMVGGGIGFNIKSLPSVEFQLMAHYFQVFQTLAGSFLDINIGASYRISKWE